MCAQIAWLAEWRKLPDECAKSDWQENLLMNVEIKAVWQEKLMHMDEIFLTRKLTDEYERIKETVWQDNKQTNTVKSPLHWQIKDMNCNCVQHVVTLFSNL